MVSMSGRFLPCRWRWLLLLVGLMLATVGAAGGAGSAVSAEEGEGFSWFQFLAPFHMVVLHLPIGLLAAVLVLEGWNWKRSAGERREVIGVLLGCGVASTVVTMALGFLRATDGGYDAITLGRHRGWGIAAAGLVTVTWGLHRHAARHPGPGALVGFRCLLATGFAAMAATGHHGGALTHGSELLTEHAPGALRHLLQATARKPWTGRVPGALEERSAGAEGFAVVHGALVDKCVGCHGPEKQKGGLRLDTREHALKPGKSGRSCVVPGDPARSELVRVLLLDAAHDEAMPPKGKERVTEAELGRIMAWVRDGAR